MDIYEFSNYRTVLKNRYQLEKQKTPSLTWKKLAAEVPMQHTYLSRVLHDNKAHLNEDQLFNIAKALGITDSDLDYLLLLRTWEVAGDNELKTHLSNRIQVLRDKRPTTVNTVNTNVKDSAAEMQYLLDPLCVVVHIALVIKKFQRDPRMLCSPLGIGHQQIRNILKILSRAGFVVLDDDGWTVLKRQKANLHFDRENRLMRLHQSLLKTQINARLGTTPDEDKDSFLFTFTMDSQGYTQVQKLAREFIKKVEAVKIQARDEGVYQMSFDVFRWL